MHNHVKKLQHAFLQQEQEEEEFKTKLPYVIEDEYIPTDPREFYNDFGKLRHDETGEIIVELTPYQYAIWKLSQKYHRLICVKPQKSGVSTSVLLQDFQDVILPGRGRGKDVLVAGQTEEASYEHISSLKRAIATSDKYRKYLITEAKELFFKEEKTKMGVIYIKNPDNPFRPSRIIAVPFQESSFWSRKQTYRVHLSDPAVTRVKKDDRIYALAFSRVANTNGYVIVESPPRGQHNGFFKQWELYKDNKSPLGTTYTVYIEDAIKYGVVTQEFIDEEKRVLGHLWFSVYGSSFEETEGNLFNKDSINKAQLEAAQYNLDIESQEITDPKRRAWIVTTKSFNSNTEKYILIDQGYSASFFAILVLEKIRRSNLRNQIRVLHTEERESPQFEVVRDRILYLRKHFGNVVNIGFDATNRLEYGMSLKGLLGEENHWPTVKAEMAEARRDGIDLASQMYVVPFIFSQESKKSMTEHTQEMLDDSRNYLCIDPRFETLLTSLKGAIFDERGMLDKDLSPHNDLLEDYMMGMQFFKMKRRGE